jgi:glycosyltransferase involved in cell wall biosynthesis
MKKTRLRELESAESYGGATRQVIPAEQHEQHKAGHSLPVQRRRLLLVCSHVVQYSSPVFQKLAQDGRLEFLVAYCSMQGAQPGVDPGFGVKVSWDTPLLEGYPWVHVPNRAARPGIGHFLGLFNPGLWKLIREGEFDAIYVSGYFYASAWIAIWAAKRYGVSLIFTTDAYSLRSLKIRSSWKLWFKKYLIRRIFGLGQAFLGTSSGSIEYLKSLGLPENRLVLYPYAVDNLWWTGRAAAVDRNEVRTRWGIPPETPVILFCAKLQPWKRPLDVLEAFAAANGPGAHLVYAGDGPLREALEARARKLGVSERVHMLGFVNQSQLPAVYCSSDLLVLPSEYDAFGLVVNEAMLCGCPVAVSEYVGARSDLVREGENGFVFPCGDINALAGIFRAYLPNSSVRSRMGEAARRRMETWSPLECVEGMVGAVELATGRR